MIAENFILNGEMAAPADGTTASRHNRNLSSIVSTIRDDGPSAAENVHRLHEEKPDSSIQLDMVEQPVVGAEEAAEAAAQRQRIRALPGMAVMSKVVAVLVLVLFIGGLALLASGRYPVIDDRGPRIAVLPASVIAEMQVVKAVVQDTFAQWLMRAKLLFSEDQAHKPEIPAPGAAGLATVAARQQQIMSRLDALAADIDTLRLNFEREQGARLVSSVSQQPEQELQLKVVQAQLAGLQQQLADDRTAHASPATPQTDKPNKQLPVKGGWVVNVASSSQEDSVRQLQVKLKKSGVDTVMQRIDGKGEPRYRLRVTGFATSGEAKRYAAGLAQESGIKGAWASKR